MTRFGARHAFVALVPYACVAIGLYGFRSAWIAFLSYHAWILAFVVLVRGEPADPPLARWMTRGWSYRVGIALSAFCAGNGALLVALWPIAARGALAESLASVGLGGASLWVFAIWYVTVHPALEEAFWRGRLLRRARGLAWTDVAFAGYHLLVLPLFVRWPWPIVAFPALVGAAWFWRRTAMRQGGLAVAVVSHAAAGIGTMAAVRFLLGR